ncbi:MAG: type II toxin-antitoxin system HicB family antitoxin [Hormoscilla sp.]
MNYHYKIVIRWSDEDECFVVGLPEWGEFCHTHGDTYEAALKNAREVLELLIESSLSNDEPLEKSVAVHRKAANSTASTLRYSSAQSRSQSGKKCERIGKRGDRELFAPRR